MALNNRLVQNIDLQGDATALQKALQSIGSELKTILASSGQFSKELESGAKAGDAQFNKTLKTMRLLIAQATTLQNILDGTSGKRTGRARGLLDEQSLGRQTAAASKLSRELNSTTTTAEALEKRLALLNKRFAELGQQGRSVSRNDLTKQFRIDDALKQVNQLQSALTRLNGRALNTPTRGASTEMTRLRSEIERVNNELLKTAQNSRKSNFQPQIDQLRALTEQYRALIAVEMKAGQMSGPRAIRANTTAQNILGQSDSQRLAALQRASSSFQFPAGISNTVSQKAAEDQLANSLRQRLRLINMIQQAQDRGAPIRSVERLNQAYSTLNQRLGEQYKLLQAVNVEQARTPGTQAFADRAARSRAAINEQLFGDGGVGFAKRIAGASVITTGVFAVINALRDSARFVVQYEAALKNLQAVSGATDSQLRSLAQGISEVSRNSTQSTLEITKAAQIIAQAGFSANETRDVLGGSVLLATASGSPTEQSADILTSTLGAFQLQATESTRIADVLVTALNRTKLSMDQVQQAIQYAGATAKENNISFDELTTIIASMAQAGIRSGSTIGTGLRQLIVDLQTPTEDFKKALTDVGLTLGDVDVKSKGFVEVVRTLKDAGFGAAQAYTSFETRAAAAFIAFQGQLPVYDELALSITRGGAAAEAQGKAMDSLQSQFTRLTNGLGQLVVLLSGPLVDGLKLLTSLLAGITESLIDLLNPIGQVIQQMGLFGDVIQTAVLTGLGFLIGGPIGAAIGLFLGFASAINSTSSELEELATKTSEASAELTSQQQTITSLDQAINRLIDRQTVLKDGSKALEVETTTLTNRFEKLNQYLDSSANKYDTLLSAMMRYRREAAAQAGLDARVAKSSAEAELTALRDNLQSGPSSWALRASPDATASREGKRVYDVGRNAATATDERSVAMGLIAVRKYSSENNNVFASLITVLEERLTQIKKIKALEAQIRTFDIQIEASDEIGTPQADLRYQRGQSFRGNVDKVLNYRGPDRLDFVRRNIKIAEDEIKSLEAQVKGSKTKGARSVLESDIATLQEQLARLRTALREDLEEKPDKAGAGRSLTGTQVAANLRRAFPGIQPTSYKPRDLKTQQRLYDNYKKGVGPLAAKPGTSRHGSGNAIDMAPLKGYTIDDIVAYVESLGLTVVEALIERNPRTGAIHWHVAWDAKRSQYGKQQETALKQLQAQRATRGVDLASKSIERILAEAKAGTGGNATQMRARLSQANNAYTVAALKDYDNKNPTSGITGAALEAIQDGRKDLEAALKERALKYVADLERAIGDEAQKAFEAASSAIEKALANAEYNVEQPVRDAERQTTVANNPLNRGRMDAGTSYYLQRQELAARLNSDRAKVSLQDQANAERSVMLSDWKDKINVMPEGEAKAGALAAYTEEWYRLGDAMKRTEELQQSINDRTEEFKGLGLNERLREGVAAWADQSGVMDTWSDTIAKNIGPALDMLTNQFADLFTKLATGQATLKSALASMIAAIGQFILQLIAKALALMAIKWFLSLIGLQLEDSPGGVVIGKKPVGQMSGGPAGKPAKFMGGGSPQGYISQGVRNRDGVPAYLAQNEYVLRGAAVDSIGVDKLDDINRFGQKALDKMGQSSVIAPQAKQEVNVYVVKPDEKPQLTKNDIVLAVTDDMLQGGQTKQLVRQISQGA